MEPGRQFLPSTEPYYKGGPAEAKQRQIGKLLRRDQERHQERQHLPRQQSEQEPQGQLFDPKSLPHAEPHTQTPEQFAGDPRTWWHGRVTPEKSRLGGAGTQEGFHAGTRGAAEQRLKAVEGRRARKPGYGGHLFPLRITGPVSGPEMLQPDVSKHKRLGRYGGGYRDAPALPIPGGGYLYENIVEAPGSISVGVPRRKGFLSTHREMVKEAEEEGKSVHPLISWAARKHPEHTGETYPYPYHIAPEGHRYRQSMLQEQFVDDPHKAAEIVRQMFPVTDNRIERTSYQTEGGKTQHVWRDREKGAGSALSPRQWMPAN